ncbi:MAG: amidohydrolase family protein, partial [Bacillota bacterium]
MKKRIAFSVLLVTVLLVSSFGFAFGANSYTVQQGDVLWKIAEQHHMTYQDLARYNNLKDPNLIYINQVLKIPDSSSGTAPNNTSSTEPSNASNTAPPSNAVVADTLLENGTIYTIDDANTVAEAIAIKDGKILFVGSKTAAEAYKGTATKVVDLKGKIVMPGFIDAHVHAPGAKLTELFDIYLYESITKEQTLADIKAFIDAHPDQKEYWGSGYTVGMAGDAKGPKAEWLDAICKDKPIILTSNDGHNMWLNSKALQLNGITKDTPNPAGGLIQKDPATGELWGSITDADSLITMTQTYTAQQQAEALKAFQESMLGWG